MKKILVLLICIGILPIFNGCNKKDDIPKYNIKISLQNNVLVGEMNVEFYLPTNNYVDFNLFASAYRENTEFFALNQEDLPLVKEFGNMEILEVEGSNETSWKTIKDNSILRVNLTKKKNEKVKVFIKYKITLSNFNHRLSIGENCVNLGNFYPILCVYNSSYVHCPYYSIGDPFYSQVANYFVELTCSGEYVVASSGFCTKTKVVDDKTTYYYNLNKARDFALCLSKNFNVEMVKYKNTDVYYYYLDENLKEEISVIKDCFNYFNSIYPYPYKTYSVCQTNFCYGGMEYPALVYVNNELTSEEKLLTIVHETAHQWWYSIVGNNQITDACLDEGLTEFFTILFFEKYQKYNISSKNLLTQKITNYNNFVTSYKVKYGLDISLSPTRNLSEYKSEADYVFTNYYYMPYSLYQIYSQSKEGFINAVKKFAKDYAFKEASIKNFSNYFYGAEKTYFNLVLQGKGVIA